MVFGDRLKEYRKQKDLTQAQLASALGVNTRTVSNYEAGNSYPNMDIISKMEALFGVRINLKIGRASCRERV